MLSLPQMYSQSYIRAFFAAWNRVISKHKYVGVTIFAIHISSAAVKCFHFNGANNRKGLFSHLLYPIYWYSLTLFTVWMLYWTIKQQYMYTYLHINQKMLFFRVRCCLLNALNQKIRLNKGLRFWAIKWINDSKLTEDFSTIRIK